MWREREEKQHSSVSRPQQLKNRDVPLPGMKIPKDKWRETKLRGSSCLIRHIGDYTLYPQSQRALLAGF